MREHQGFLLFEYQRGHIVGVEEIAGNSLEFFGGDCVDSSIERFKVAFVPMVEIASSEVKGKLFTVVAGNGELSFQLALGGNQLLAAERFLHQAVQLMTYQSATAFNVVVIAAEVNAPNTSITIGCHRALYRIYQSVPFS